MFCLTSGAFPFPTKKIGSKFHVGSWEKNTGSSEINKYLRITFIYLCAYTQTQMCVGFGSGNYFCPSSFKYLICEEKSSLEPCRFFCFVFWGFLVCFWFFVCPFFLVGIFVRLFFKNLFNFVMMSYSS